MGLPSNDCSAVLHSRFIETRRPEGGIQILDMFSKPSEYFLRHLPLEGFHDQVSGFSWKMQAINVGPPVLPVRTDLEHIRGSEPQFSLFSPPATPMQWSKANWHQLPCLQYNFFHSKEIVLRSQIAWLSPCCQKNGREQIFVWKRIITSSWLISKYSILWGKSTIGCFSDSFA